VTVCPSESFEALSDGLQSAKWELGGVPRRHREGGEDTRIPAKAK